MKSTFPATTSNIYRLSTPEKEVNRKENTGKIAERRQIRKSTHALFHNVTSCDDEDRDLSSKIYRVSFGGAWCKS